MSKSTLLLVTKVHTKLLLSSFDHCIWLECDLILLLYKVQESIEQSFSYYVGSDSEEQVNLIDILKCFWFASAITYMWLDMTICGNGCDLELLKASGAYIFRPNGTHSIGTEGQVITCCKDIYFDVLHNDYWKFQSQQLIKVLSLEVSGFSYYIPGTTVGWSTSKDQFMDISSGYPVTLSLEWCSSSF